MRGDAEGQGKNVPGALGVCVCVRACLLEREEGGGQQQLISGGSDGTVKR